MIWFLIALLVALGGILVAYRRAKAMPVVVPIDLISPRDTCIDITDPRDVQRWTKELRVDEYDLKGAVQDVGASAEAVSKALRDK